MANKSDLHAHINKGYTFKGDSITLGGAMFEGKPVEDALIKVPLKTLNRHGLIAGATGTGKTKSLQVMAEELSKKGIPSLLMDIKGDLSGIAASGENNDHIEWRHGSIGVPYNAEPMPVELMTLTQKGKGTRLKATVSEFGPILLSKILGLNDTQGSIVSLLFMYCDDNNLPLIDLKDLRKSLQYINGDGKDAIEEEYGMISSASVSTIMRKVIELEQQGADEFFGERSFEVKDLVRTAENGYGLVSIIRLMDIQNKPKLFSTFMLSLLAEIYGSFPEQGDADKPKLCIFIDEAHLVFEEATDELLDQIETIIKLIRSKGVGIFFCTQNPQDVPEDVLAQLGLKVQHALRAFTAKDRKAIAKAAENYPLSDFYNTDELITQLGIGEALVTALNEKGIPTPLAATLCRAPATRMDVLSPIEVDNVVKTSEIKDKYNEAIDRESAYEILTQKIKQAKEDERIAELEAIREKEEEELRKKEEARRIKEEKEWEKRQAKIEREEERERAKAERDRSKRRRSTTTRRRSTRKRTSTRRKTSSEADMIGDIARGLLGVFGL
ncbi:MAG: helicase HerA-like domain-containing protein [Lishizhenia sp.]